MRSARALSILNFLLFFGIISWFLVAIPSQVHAAASLYPPIPATETDPYLTGTIDGQAFVFQKELVHHPSKSNRYNIGWTRFSGSGSVTVTINSPQPITGYVLRSIGRDIIPTHTGNSLTFQLPGPGSYYLKLHNVDMTYLFFYDPSNVRTVQPGQANVVDVRSKGVTPNAGGNQRGAIQNAINSCPANCILYFPPGLYQTGRLSFENKHNMTLYVDKGALIKGVDNPDDFGGPGGHMLLFGNSSNITISGLGAIDANGPGTWNFDGREIKIHLAQVDNSDTIRFENIILRNSNSWNLHIYNTNNFVADNIKVFSGKDGIDPDSARNVVINDVAIVAVDDAVAIKSRGGQSTENVQVTNCLVSSTKTALKIGTENRKDIRNITFDTCEVWDGDRGLSVSTKAGGVMDNITYKNIRLWMTRWGGESHTGKVIYIDHDNQEGSQSLNNLTFENIYGLTFRDSTLKGGGITMKNINMYLERADNNDVFTGSGSEVLVQGIRFYWMGNKKSWNRTFSGRGFNVSGEEQINEGGPPMAFPDPPVRKGCALSLAKENIPANARGRVILEAASSVWNPEPARIILSKQGSLQISPVPPGSTEVFYSNQFYGYPLDGKVCQTGGDQICQTAADLPVLPPGKYELFCDMPTQPNRCSGNPICTYSGGTFNCENWVPCSGKDSVILTVENPPSPSPSPVAKPGDTDRDGDVDIFDYNNIITTFGSTNCDINQLGTCQIDIFDFNVVVENFGK